MASLSEDFHKTVELVRKRIPYKISMKSVKNEKVMLLSEMKNLNETTAFIAAYEAVTHSSFRIISNKTTPNSSTCRRKWMCNHYVVSGMNKKCPASISIIIKAVNTQNMLQDVFQRKNSHLPAVIKINPNHNHDIVALSTTCQLYKINNDVKKCFYEYFKRGYFYGGAKSFHEQNLRKANFLALEDDSMNPTLQAIYTLANNWLKVQENVELNIASNNKSSKSLPSTRKRKKKMKKERKNKRKKDIKEENEIERSSSQTLENFINVRDVVSKLKKEPGNEYIITENNPNKNVEDISLVLTIKEEIVVEDENDALPVLSEPDNEYIIPDNTANKIVKDFQPVLTIKQEKIDEDENEGFPVISEPNNEYIIPDNTANKIVKDFQPVLTIKQEKIDEDENERLPVISGYDSLAVPSLSILSPQSLLNTAIEKPPAVVKVQTPSSQAVVYNPSSKTYKIIKCLSGNTGAYSSNQYKSYLPSGLVPMRISLQRL